MANEITQYTLTYDIIQPPDKPDEIISHYWGWKGEWVTLGMTEPTRANWYWQTFFNWHFDGESLYNRRATLRVLRQSGPDGLVEYSWETPKARVAIRFALAAASDKLLMFGQYEPKQEVKECYLRLSCYPGTFSKPWHRTVTTAGGTTPAGGQVQLDLARQRWVLYEDVKEDRPTSGPAGLLVGTPQAFDSVSIPVTGYGIVTRLDLKPGQRTFALALYSFPPMPGVEKTRDYFRSHADREARWLEQVEASHLDEPLPPLPVPETRQSSTREAMGRLFSRPVERWCANPRSLRFPWAKKLAGGPLRAVILCPRWCAYETMELARRLDLDVRHIYFDTRGLISDARSWPYTFNTGVGPTGLGAASIRALGICMDPEVDLFLCAGVAGPAVPEGCRKAVLRHVRAGRGLLLVGSGGWPKDLFALETPETAEAVLSALPWQQVPGYREDERGRIGTGAPLAAYRYGQGRVLDLKVKLNTYSSLVPRNDATEGLRGATDRCLALCAKAALAATDYRPSHTIEFGNLDADGRSVGARVSPAPPAKSSLLVRIQDDLDRELLMHSFALPLDGDRLPLPRLPAGRKCFIDVALRDGEARCIDFTSAVLPEIAGPSLERISLSPSTLVHEAAVPRVELPAGGTLKCRAHVRSPTPHRDGRVLWQVRDVSGRLLARAETSVPAQGGDVAATLRLTKPVGVCHSLDVSLRSGDDELAFARQRFAVTMDYPYDDFTALMWSYAGGDPVLTETTRRCYEMGADMMDLCHMGGYSDAGAAREYSVAARSGLRLLPYVTRIAGSASSDHFRVPCLHDPTYLEKVCEHLTVTCRQASAYSPVAFTLGDENYLFRGDSECCHRPESVTAFQQWLKDKYRSIDALNRAWCTGHESFEAIVQPMLLTDAGKQTASFAPWIDHKRFMDTAFAQAHEQFAAVVRQQVPGAKVGWDGFLGYTWRAGYDFTKLTANLELNQTYVRNWIQSALIRSFKRPDALTGTWGNSVADDEAGWSAWPWHSLFRGDSSVWWWTSWGCYYIPFNPDLSLNDFGKWFFASVREVKAGPGKLLLHAKRQHSGIAVLYSQPDLFASAIMKKINPDEPYAGSPNFWRQHRGLLRGITDLGHQYRHLSYRDLEGGKLSSDEFRVAFLCLASCLSDNQVAALRRFVESGGTLVVDGRAGLLTGDGKIREARPLDEMLGVRSAAGLSAVKETTETGTTSFVGALSASDSLQIADCAVDVLEPSLRCTIGTALGQLSAAPLAVSSAFGKGRTVVLNVALGPIMDVRTQEGPRPLMELLSAVLRSASVRPPCQLTRDDGSAPICTERAVFADGDARYLATDQDLLLPKLEPQPLRVRLPRPEIVYDVRAGKRVGAGRLAEWSVTLSRGRPLLYALLPYEVRSVSARASAESKRGCELTLSAEVQTSTGTAGFHVVRLNVFAPAAREPHRQYSQNIACPRGRGAGTVPFALDDELGTWRLELRDVASGVVATKTVTLVE